VAVAFSVKYDMRPLTSLAKMDFAAIDGPSSDHKRTKRKFTTEEDNLIRELVDQHGTKQWDVIARSLPERTSRQIRDRWKHYLAPGVSLRAWTLDEDRLLLHIRTQLGPQWSTIMRFFPGRTDVNLKNRWNRLQRRSLKLNAVARPGGQPGQVGNPLDTKPDR
jgi:hypothetical protein